MIDNMNKIESIENLGLIKIHIRITDQVVNNLSNSHMVKLRSIRIELTTRKQTSMKMIIKKNINLREEG